MSSKLVMFTSLLSSFFEGRFIIALINSCLLISVLGFLSKLSLRSITFLLSLNVAFEIMTCNPSKEKVIPAFRISACSFKETDYCGGESHFSCISSFVISNKFVIALLSSDNFLSILNCFSFSSVLHPHIPSSVAQSAC